MCQRKETQDESLFTSWIKKRSCYAESIDNSSSLITEQIYNTVTPSMRSSSKPMRWKGVLIPGSPPV